MKMLQEISNLMFSMKILLSLESAPKQALKDSIDKLKVIWVSYDANYFEDYNKIDQIMKDESKRLRI